MKNKKTALLILLVVILSFTFSSYVRATPKESNSVLINMLEKADLDKIDYLQKVNITQEEYTEIESFTLDLIKYCNTDTDKMDTIFKWVNSNVKYGNSNNDPYQVFINKRGVCQGYANLYSVMMKVANIPTIILEGDTYFGAHAWCLSLIDNNWILADPTNNAKKYNIKDYDKNYTDYYYLPYYINTDLFEDNNYKYSYYNGVALVGIKNSESILTIPESIDGMDVTSFCTSALNSSILELNIGKNITNIEINSNNGSNIEKLDVDTNNPVYSSYSNVLYTKDFSSIVYIPQAIKEITLKPFKTLYKNILYGLNSLEEVKIEEGTVQIDSYAFEANSSLKRIYIPRSVTSIDKDAFYNCGNYTLYVYDNSYAHKFAQDNNIPFIIIDSQLLKGDINKDGKINSTDSALVLDKFTNSEVSDSDLDIADMNNDGKLNSEDAAIILDIYSNNRI